jgi:hypothetical protein
MNFHRIQNARLLVLDIAIGHTPVVCAFSSICGAKMQMPRKMMQ